MYLSKEEERLLNGNYGEPYSRAMEVVVKIGEALGADRLVKISHAHISGISFKSVGEAGLDLMREFKGVKVRTFTTCNPAGIEPRFWGEMGVEHRYFRMQMEIIDILRSMGVYTTCSCTPYYLRKPHFGEHLAWGESNAVLYANSLYGARTNRVGAPLSFFSAVVGRTPFFGLHLDENRMPTARIIVRNMDRIRKVSEAGALGYVVGEVVGKGVPYLGGVVFENEATVKSFLAAVGTSSQIGMVLIDRISPEARNIPLGKMEKITIGRDELEKWLEERGEPEAFLLGCPHASESEVLRLYRLIRERGKVRKPFYVTTSFQVYGKLSSSGVVQKLESLGVKFLAGSCLVVGPLREIGVGSIATNSIKAAHYVEHLQGVRVFIMELEEMVKMAYGG